MNSSRAPSIVVRRAALTFRNDLWRVVCTPFRLRNTIPLSQSDGFVGAMPRLQQDVHSQKNCGRFSVRRREIRAGPRQMPVFMPV